MLFTPQVIKTKKMILLVYYSEHKNKKWHCFHSLEGYSRTILGYNAVIDQIIWLCRRSFDMMLKYVYVPFTDAKEEEVDKCYGRPKINRTCIACGWRLECQNWKEIIRKMFLHLYSLKKQKWRKMICCDVSKPPKIRIIQVMIFSVKSYERES